VIWLVGLLACSPSTTETDDGIEMPEGGVITVLTEDDVSITADYYPASMTGRPAVVLLHMIPPNFDRSSWPADFITELHDNDWNVLVPDRRGAGDSEGTAVDAYEGDGGRMDVAALVSQLEEDGAGDLMLIGASNGTTSVLDYTVWAAQNDVRTPVAAGFMSGGPYTENQSSFADMPLIPAFFSYEDSDRERDWATTQQDRGVGAWEFWYLDDPGAHGTNAFDSDPATVGRIDQFLEGAVAP